MKFSQYTGIFAICAAAVSCAEHGLTPESGIPGGSKSSGIEILCYTGTGASADTKSLIQSNSSATLESNFIYIEDRNPYSETENYPALSESYIVESSIFAPHGISDNGKILRSTSFEPALSYKVELAGSDGSDTTFYKTRMVGWYPRTCELIRDSEGNIPVQPFHEFEDSYYSEGEVTGVTFRNVLDGQTDVMVSDMREGMHMSNAYKSGEADALPPFGSENYFSFKHYLTAVKIYLKCNLNDLSLLSWGTIESVVFLDQPSTVTISLPEKPRDFGEAVRWEDNRDMDIVTTPIFGDEGESVSYPVVIADDVNEDLEDQKIYLGYMLLQPEREASFEIHTDAGVYQLTIPVTLEGNPMLKRGNVYNINIDISTEGELGIFVETDDDKVFKDLSPWNIVTGKYETANCYLINTLEDVDADGNPLYDGYFFNAMQAGNGEDGVLNVTNRELYPEDGARIEPYSAAILFQTQLNTVRNVELVDGHVRFVLNEECYDSADPLQANAVIAVYDREGNILWSWLIWVTQEAEDINYFYRGEDYALLNMNLGATAAIPDDANSAIKSYGLYYQWGRKDPSPRPPRFDFDMLSMETIPYYGPNGEMINYISVFSSDENTIEDSARNPLLIMEQNIQGPNYAFDWLYYEIDQLWGYSPVMGEVVMKTIYDPCPYGYRIADDEIENLFNYLTYQYGRYSINEYGLVINGSASTDGKVNFFPFAGWKGFETDKPDKGHPWNSCGVIGDYQDARTMTATRHRASSRVSSTGGISTGNGSNRTAAAPVRCVRYSNEPPSE